MEVILHTFVDDEWYEHIVQWRLASRKRKEVINDPYLFYYSYTPQQTAPENASEQPA
jgi:hypothetical protein